MMHLVVPHKEFHVPGQIKGSRQYDNTIHYVLYGTGKGCRQTSCGVVPIIQSPPYLQERGRKNMPFEAHRLHFKFQCSLNVTAEIS